MANRNTKSARAAGFASKKDQNNNGTRIFEGKACNTRWDAPESKHKKRKVYQRNKGE